MSLKYLNLIGDIHGCFNTYNNIVCQSDAARIPTLQVGDMGIGFDYRTDNQFKKIFQKYTSVPHRFIRGNHDNPSVCKEKFSSECIQKYGYISEYDMFCVSGAYSVDVAYRTPGIDWWPDEQLSLADMLECYDEYMRIKPKYVVSHDAPLVFADKLMNGVGSICLPLIETATGHLLQKMFDNHKPHSWWCGHHHKTQLYTCESVNFRCIDINEVVTLTLE